MCGYSPHKGFISAYLDYLGKEFDNLSASYDTIILKRKFFVKYMI